MHVGSVDLHQGLNGFLQQLVLNTFEVFIVETGVQHVSTEFNEATCLYSTAMNTHQVGDCVTLCLGLILIHCTVQGLFKYALLTNIIC